mgnify:CR=1 FL=1
MKKQLAFLALALPALALVWARFIEPDWLEGVRVTVPTAKLPRGQRFTVALLSDLHLEHQTRALTRVQDVLRAERPDLLVHAGDALNDAAALPLLRRTLGGLPARLGRYAVRGDHDVRQWGHLDLFAGGPATELTGGAPVLLEGGALALCGVPWGAPERAARCLEAAPPQAFVIFAYHSPELIETLTPRPHLYLAGHTHGGQVRVPFFGSLLDRSRFGARYAAGRYEVRNTTLYVSRGLGFTPGSSSLRFGARPELTLLTLEGE